VSADSRTSRWRVDLGDSLELLPTLPSESVDAVVTDPPYGIDFQHADWDGRTIDATAEALAGERISGPAAFEEFSRAWAEHCLTALKPGGHLAAFGAPRTAHRLACALEDAGFELRDTLMWLYGQGLPKSRRLPGGRGTALKPAYEPILLARKPPVGTIRRNVRERGTGALNVVACGPARPGGGTRWPPDVVLAHEPACAESGCADGCAVAQLDAQAGRPVSRFFYCPKARRDERDAGCDQLPKRALDLFPNAGDATYQAPAACNAHPTVKPLALMRWLVRLTCPPGGVVLDCFCGSGSTGAAAVLEGRRFVGIERDPDYARVARARVSHWAARPATEVRSRPFASESEAA
jgi:DNA modification methylase